MYLCLTGSSPKSPKGKRVKSGKGKKTPEPEPEPAEPEVPPGTPPPEPGSDQWEFVVQPIEEVDWALTYLSPF